MTALLLKARTMANAINVFKLSLRATNGSVAISYFEIVSSSRKCETPHNDSLINAFGLIDPSREALRE